jgi:hypothetical protein
MDVDAAALVTLQAVLNVAGYMAILATKVAEGELAAFLDVAARAWRCVRLRLRLQRQRGSSSSRHEATRHDAAARASAAAAAHGRLLALLQRRMWHRHGPPTAEDTRLALGDVVTLIAHTRRPVPDAPAGPCHAAL